MNIEEQLLAFFFDCTKDVFYKEIIYSNEFISSIILPIFICGISCTVGIKHASILNKQAIENTIRKFSIFIIIRTVIIIAISFLLIKLYLVFIKLFLVLLFSSYFIFKIIEIIQINRRSQLPDH